MSDSPMPFGKNNYIIMLVGIALLIIGFIIMAHDSEPYGLGFNGITLGPIIVMAGFITELFAITRKPKTKE
ncbi:MAG: DUF3098 domain-containing protein [Cyclobacteriaceae bacterium]|nr:DUF3098 domain-containing protein [Cyclobacteriaceae bacterium]